MSHMRPLDQHRSTLMTVHAHPDDEVIGTGGVMARAVAIGQAFGCPIPAHLATAPCQCRLAS